MTPTICQVTFKRSLPFRNNGITGSKIPDVKVEIHFSPQKLSKFSFFLCVLLNKLFLFLNMTTAARPTFEPARGGRGKGENDLSALSKQYSSRDLPSHNKLKYRQEGQGAAEELRGRDFRKDLEDRERAVREKKDRNRESSSSSKRPRLEPASNLDADYPVDDEDEESDSDDDDDTMELMAELQKIKKERVAEAAKIEAERKVEEERIRKENILKGNPLLNQEKVDFKVKRRWDDDVVFKNCAKGGDDKNSRGFINDTLRSEFHKKFMEKYVK